MCIGAGAQENFKRAHLPEGSSPNTSRAYTVKELHKWNKKAAKQECREQRPVEGNLISSCCLVERRPTALVRCRKRGTEINQNNQGTFEAASCCVVQWGALRSVALVDICTLGHKQSGHPKSSGMNGQVQRRQT
jgi:hypothetical protein